MHLTKQSVGSRLGDYLLIQKKKMLFILHLHLLRLHFIHSIRMTYRRTLCYGEKVARETEHAQDLTP